MSHSFAQHAGESGSMENIVTQYQADAVASDEFASDEESLSQSVGRGLFCIFEAYAEIATVSQQPTESRQIVRRGYD